MRALSIFGSPKDDGFSSTIHENFLAPFDERGIEVEKVFPNKKKIGPCTACGYCRGISECIFSDDMTEIYSLIRDSDIITVSSPLYFSSFPSPLKALMDRCQLIWEERKRGGASDKTKKGFFICSGGDDYSSMFSGVIKGMKHYFNSMGVSFTEENTILYRNTDSIDQISLEFLNNVRYAGEAFLQK